MLYDFSFLFLLKITIVCFCWGGGAKPPPQTLLASQNKTHILRIHVTHTTVMRELASAWCCAYSTSRRTAQARWQWQATRTKRSCNMTAVAYMHLYISTLL